MKRQEKLKLVGAMVTCHCRKVHRQRTLCDSCSGLFNYITERLNACRLPEESSSCFLCPDYCYSPEMRTKIGDVMRSAAPRMILKRPVLMIRHLLHLQKLHRHL